MSCLGWVFLYLMFIFFYVVMCVDMYFDFGIKSYNVASGDGGQVYFFDFKF